MNESQYSNEKVYNTSFNHTKQRTHDLIDRGFIQRTNPYDRSLPPYRPMFEKISIMYDSNSPSVHAIADLIITDIGRSSGVWHENFLLHPFKHAQEYFYSGLGNIDPFKDEVKAEVIKIITSILPVKHTYRQSIFRRLVGLQYKERFFW